MCVCAWQSRIYDVQFGREAPDPVLFAGIPILALILFAVGLYSVVSYSVGQLINEVGIRMALGAGQAHVLRVVIASAGVSDGVGIIFGLILSLRINRVISGWVGNKIAIQ